MSQKAAVWNLVLSAFPAVGLLLFLIPLARGAPMRFFLVSAALYVVGLCLFVAAKISVWRTSRYVSFGSKGMSAGNRRSYRTGYVLMAGGLVGGLLFAIAWQAQ